MVTVVKDVISSAKHPADRFSEEFIALKHGKAQGGVADVPDTTSKIATEKNAEKNTGVVSWFQSWNNWIWGEQAASVPTIEKVTAPLALKPKLPKPRAAASKTLAQLLSETNIITGRVQEASESERHKIYISLYQEQVKLRESAAQSQIGRLQMFRKQLQVNKVTQQMLMEEINYGKTLRPYLNTIHKTLSAAVLTTFALSALTFVASSTGGTAIPVLGWLVSHATSLRTAIGIAQVTGTVGSGITQGTSTYLQHRSETAEAKAQALRHQNDVLDHEIKAFQQWLKEVFTAVNRLQSQMRKVEQKRFEASKPQE